MDKAVFKLFLFEEDVGDVAVGFGMGLAPDGPEEGSEGFLRLFKSFVGDSLK